MAFVALRPLRHRNFALLFASGFISNAGTWMQTVAVGALVAKLTGSYGWTGFVQATAFLPLGLLAPVGGAIADRVDRRRFLMLANLAEAGCATCLAVIVATGNATALRIAGLVFVQGCITSLRLPFIQAMLPDLVGREDLLAAASLGAAQYNLGRVFGPALAGVVIAVGGFSWAFAVNAASFFAVIAALVFVRDLPPPPPSEPEPMLRRIRAGARAAWAEPGCRAAISLIAVAAFLIAPFIALIAAKALSLVGRDDVARATAALTTAQGIGAVIGALSLAGLAMRFGRGRVLVFHLLTTPAALILYAAAPSVVTAVLALSLVGMLYIGILSGLQTVVQLRAPEAFRGRVLSFHTVALGSIYPIGTLVQGQLADVFGLQPVTTVFALALIAVVGGLLVFRPRFLAALDDPEHEHAPPVDRETVEAEAVVEVARP
jgi:MFS family permease